MPNLTPDFDWNERALRYRNRVTGKFVSSKVIVGALDNVITASSRNIETITQALLDGNISLVDWRAGMAGEMKIIHTAAAAASKGGWAQMTPSDWGKVGSLLKDQYKYLDNFAGQIASGKVPLDGRLMVRAKLYAGAGHGTYEDMKRRLFEQRGYTEERRVLTPGENCNGCIEQAGRGWSPIGTLDRIGSEECRSNCRCDFEYR